MSLGAVGKCAFCATCILAVGILLLEPWQDGLSEDHGRRLQAQMKRITRVVRIFVPGTASDDTETDPLQMMSSMTNMLVNLISALVQLAVAACVYNSFKDKRVTSWAGVQGSDGNFPNGLCECMKDPQIAVCGCCCSLLRTAQTQHQAGLRQFWPTLLICFVLFIWPSFLGYVCFVAFRYVLRSELRQAAGLSPGLNDCCIVCCCLPCSICQEARFVNMALESGGKQNVGQIVGEPVVLG